jgi:ABC-2 type transport system permease protein
MSANRTTMWWSVRRELWENTSIYVVPLAAAGLMILGLLIAAIAGVSTHGLKFNNPDPDKLVRPFNFAALLMMGATFIVSVVYCLDALQGERRDRSVLFWKSMPVSDVTTVMSKAAVPFVILPLIGFLMTIATQFVMLLMGTAILIASGHSAAGLWTGLPWLRMSGMLLYHLFSIHSLYYAPLFGWLFLVSAWARRAPFLWAVLPPFAIGVIEKIVFNTSYFARMLGNRMNGGSGMESNSKMPVGVEMLGHFHPIAFLMQPGLWIGLALSALFLFAAVRLRRYRGA